MIIVLDDDSGNEVIILAEAIFLVFPLADMLWSIISHVSSFLFWRCSASWIIIWVSPWKKFLQRSLLPVTLEWKNTIRGVWWGWKLLYWCVFVFKYTHSYFNSSNFVGRSSSSSSAVSILYFLSFLFMKFKYARPTLALWLYPCNTACHVSFFRRIHSCVVRNFRVRPIHPMPCKWFVVPRSKKNGGS